MSEKIEFAPLGSLWSAACAGGGASASAAPAQINPATTGRFVSFMASSFVVRNARASGDNFECGGVGSAGAARLRAEPGDHDAGDAGKAARADAGPGHRQRIRDLRSKADLVRLRNRG